MKRRGFVGRLLGVMAAVFVVKPVVAEPEPDWVYAFKADDGVTRFSYESGGAFPSLCHWTSPRIMKMPHVPCSIKSCSLPMCKRRQTEYACTLPIHGSDGIDAHARARFYSPSEALTWLEQQPYVSQERRYYVVQG